MPTPEGAVKQKVSKLLKATPGLYYWMPVQAGYGEATLDYVGCFHGYFFAIETKAPKRKPTARQNITIENMRRAGAKVFVTDGPTEEIEEWLRSVAGSSTSAP